MLPTRGVRDRGQCYRHGTGGSVADTGQGAVLPTRDRGQCCRHGREGQGAVLPTWDRGQCCRHGTGGSVADEEREGQGGAVLPTWDVEEEVSSVQ